MHRHKSRDGGDLWFNLRLSPIISSSGSVEKVILLAHDVTELLKAKGRIKKSESLYKLLFDSAPDGIQLIDKDGIILDCNETEEQISGFSRKEHIGKPTAVFLTEKSRALFKKYFPVLKKQGRADGEVELLKKDGSFIPVWRKAKALYDDEGNFDGAVIYNRDISKLRETEEANINLGRIFDNSLNEIYIFDAVTYKFLRINRGAKENLGYPEGECCHLTPLDIKPDITKEQFDELLRPLREGKKKKINFSTIHRRKDGTTYPVEVFLQPATYGGKDAFVAIVPDITERKRAEQAQQVMLRVASGALNTTEGYQLYELLKNELNILIDTSNFFIGIYNKENDTISFPYMEDQKDDFKEVPAAQTISKYVIKDKKSILLRGEEVENFIKENNIERIASPSKCWLGVPLIVDNEVIGLIVVQSYDNPYAYDEADKKLLEFVAGQMAESIRRKEVESIVYQLSRSVEQSPVSTVITDLKGNIQYVNPKFCQVTGYSFEEVEGKNPRVLKSGQQNEAFYSELWETILNGKEWRGMLVNKKKDGTLYTEEATISPVFNSVGRIVHFIAIKRDITKERELEQQFHQAQKMESIGRLAGGVAHDFNNMLAVILGYSELALSKLQQGKTLYTEIQEIAEAGRRSANLISQLLAFSRKQTISPRPLDLNETIRNILKMLRRLIGENIDLIWIPGNNLGTVFIDPSQIDQILVNLCVNARDAIDVAGKIVIETSNIIFDEDYVNKHLYTSAGSYVMISFSDNGCGMDNNVKNKIFEPFFTTKAPGEGTGLGLATVYGIVKQNKGFINVYSEKGKGTTFKLYFPEYLQTNKIIEAEEKESIPLGSGEIILLVEDEKSILEMTRSMLESINYKVLSAGTPEEALKIAQQEHQKIHLLMTDVIMPGITGMELAKKLHEFYPDLQVLYMSGYTANVIVHHGVLDEGINFIAKPFSLLQLAKKLKETMENKEYLN